METGVTTARKFLGAMAALMIAASTNGQSAPSLTAAVTMVLVHGALIDGSSWRGVYDVLTRGGYRVSIVQQPLTGLDKDVAATRRVLDQQDGPVVLVGHSYGGSIITVAGCDPKVKALVYVAALQPDVGETTGQLVPNMPPVSNDFRRTQDGFIFFDPAKFAADFGADLPKAQAEFMARSQMPVFGAAFDAKLTAAAWHDKPSYAVLITQPRAVARVIETAARARICNTQSQQENPHARG
jgi:pimeloyl-ACP methyl ester carboxylesterase